MLKFPKQHRAMYILVVVVILLLLRLIINGFVPLLDKTEARYSEIARLMVETNEWIVLQIDYGQPFWAKPPLSTWLSALSMLFFGVNEFASRLPSFLLNIGLILILWRYINQTKNGLLLFFVLLTTPTFFIHSGVVSTDTALCFGVSLTMIAFWKAINMNRLTIWGYLFFVGIAIGLLSKGPLSIVLTGPPILIWLIISKTHIKLLFKRVPWITGTLLCLLLAIPWYVFTEQRSPGFIDYFIIGEHFGRFLESKWEGDLYGGPKSEPIGMIWVFFLIFAFPWIEIVLIKLVKFRKDLLNNKYLTYLVFWMLWTPLFFSLSKNILHTYILPATVPMALLVVYFWDELQNKKLMIGLASILPVAAIIALMVLLLKPDIKNLLNTDKYLVKNLENKSLPIVYWKQKSFSAEFYTKGETIVIKNEHQLDSLSDVHDSLYLFVLDKKKKSLPDQHLENLKLLDSNYKTMVYRLSKQK